MKKGIHPTTNDIKVIMTNGDAIVIKSTYNKGKEMRLDVDPFNHPAWTGKRAENNRGGQTDKFKSRFEKFTTKK
jgi:ribosomal protein L31